MTIQQPPPQNSLWSTPKVTDQDAMFDAAHPTIYSLFSALAAELVSHGVRRGSSDEILHQMRWQHKVENRGEEYAVNNSWSAYLARRLIRDQPAFGTFFELRKSKHDTNHTGA